jgi:two-component system sensor histidine kinase/response regulator
LVVVLEIEECQAFGDENMIRTVLRNLVSNSIKFTPRKGTITLGCRPKPGSVHEVEIYVQDSGVGLGKDIIDEITGPVDFRSHLGTEGEKGTGLGLPLVYYFIRRNRGTLEFESPSQGGTLIRVSLPSIDQSQEN